MFGSKKNKKNGASKKTCAVSFIGEDKIFDIDRDILVLRLNSQIVNLWNTYESVEFYLAGVGEFDNLALKILNFYKDIDGNIHKSKCYIVTPELKLIDSKEIDPFYFNDADEKSLEKIRDFLIKDKVLISFVPNSDSKLTKYIRASIMQGNPTLNLHVEEP